MSSFKGALGWFVGGDVPDRRGQLVNLSMCHAIPAFVTLLWGEELFLGWVIAGCFRRQKLAVGFRI